MIQYQVTIEACGKKSWRVGGQLHREDGPAEEWASGDKLWFLNGKLHREDGPAIEYSEVDKYWFLNGVEVTEEEHKKFTSKATCSGKVVEIEGIKYELKEV